MLIVLKRLFMLQREIVGNVVRKRNFFNTAKLRMFDISDKLFEEKFLKFPKIFFKFLIISRNCFLKVEKVFQKRILSLVMSWLLMFIEMKCLNVKIFVFGKVYRCSLPYYIYGGK